MKKPVKKAVKPARKKVRTSAGVALPAKRRTPVRAAKAAPRIAKPRSQALVIPPILLETAPPPLVPRISESQLVETPLAEAQLLVQERVEERVENIQTSPVQSSKPRFLTVSVLEVAPIIPTLAHAQTALVNLEPAMAPQPAVTEQMAIHVPEPLALHPGVPVMEFQELERGILHLLARDPHCLFATWDFPAGALALHRLRAVDGCIHLKVAVVGQGGEHDVILTPEACEWFIPVARAGAEYRVEMGYRNRAGAWVPIADPALAATPAEAPAEPATAQMHTVVFPVLETPVPGILSTGLGVEPEPLVRNFPAARITPASDVPWIPEVQAALATLGAPVQTAKSVGMANSLQWVEMVGPEREIPGPVSGPQEVPGTAPVPQPGGLPSSFPGVFSLPTSFLPGQSVQPGQPGAVPGRKFWFTVNAELVIYGATEPDARVEIGSHPIRLRPDGGFSFRFALPDGQFELPVAALSADGVDFRGAVLRFERSTQTAGEVGMHPQDSNLMKPAPESCV